MRNPYLSVLLVLSVFLSAVAGCAAALPIVRSVDDIARSMCAAYFGQKQGVSVEDAARMYCATREAWAPWIDPALKAQQSGAAAAEKAGGPGTGCTSGACGLSTPADAGGE